MSAPPNAGPYFVGPETPCGYCRVPIRMYGSQFSEVGSGELHSCPVNLATFVGPFYWRGDFAFLDYRLAALPSSPPAQDAHE